MPLSRDFHFASRFPGSYHSPLRPSAPPDAFPQPLPRIALLHGIHAAVAGNHHGVHPCPVLNGLFAGVLALEEFRQPNRGRLVSPPWPSPPSWFGWEQGRKKLAHTFPVDEIGGEHGAMGRGRVCGRGWPVPCGWRGGFRRGFVVSVLRHNLGDLAGRPGSLEVL